MTALTRNHLKVSFHIEMRKISGTRTLQNIHSYFRLGSVQENGISVHIPLLRTIRDPQKEDKQLYLQQIRQIIPNHDARMSTLAVSVPVFRIVFSSVMDHCSLITKFYRSCEISISSKVDQRERTQTSVKFGERVGQDILGGNTFPLVSPSCLLTVLMNSAAIRTDGKPLHEIGKNETASV